MHPFTDKGALGSGKSHGGSVGGMEGAPASSKKKVDAIKAVQDSSIRDPLSGLLSDPLSSMLQSNNVPPLPSLSSSVVSSSSVASGNKDVNEGDDNTVKLDSKYDWNLRKDEILKSYEVTGTIKVKSVRITIMYVYNWKDKVSNILSIGYS